jgi:hypothetical protein
MASSDPYHAQINAGTIAIKTTALAVSPISQADSVSAVGQFRLAQESPSANLVGICLDDIW